MLIVFKFMEAISDILDMFVIQKEKTNIFEILVTYPFIKYLQTFAGPILMASSVQMTMFW